MSPDLTIIKVVWAPGHAHLPARPPDVGRHRDLRRPGGQHLLPAIARRGRRERRHRAFPSATSPSSVTTPSTPSPTRSRSTPAPSTSTAATSSPSPAASSTPTRWPKSPLRRRPHARPLRAGERGRRRLTHRVGNQRAAFDDQQGVPNGNHPVPLEETRCASPVPPLLPASPKTRRRRSSSTTASAGSARSGCDGWPDGSVIGSSSSRHSPSRTWPRLGLTDDDVRTASYWVDDGRRRPPRQQLDRARPPTGARLLAARRPSRSSCP